MKIYILLFLLLSNLMAITVKDAAFSLNAQTNIYKALKKANHEDKKLVLLLIIKEGCSWCEIMIEETMHDKQIKDALHDAVVVVADMNSTLAKNLKTEHTPSMYFIDTKSRKIIYEEVGYVKSGSFLISIISTMELIDEK